MHNLLYVVNTFCFYRRSTEDWLSSVTWCNDNQINSKTAKPMSQKSIRSQIPCMRSHARLSCRVVAMTVDYAPKCFLKHGRFTHIFNPTAEDLYNNQSFEVGRHPRLVQQIQHLTNCEIWFPSVPELWRWITARKVFLKNIMMSQWS